MSSTSARRWCWIFGAVNVALAGQAAHTLVDVAGIAGGAVRTSAMLACAALMVVPGCLVIRAVTAREAGRG
jgi:uncharacterized membrane protein